MENKELPSPVFRYDPADMPALKKRMETWDELSDLPELGVKAVHVKPDAVGELSRELQALGVKTGNTVILVMDRTPMTIAGEDLKPMVSEALGNAGYKVHKVELESDAHGLVHPDFVQVEYVRERLQPGCGVVSLGSGVVTDITKHACYLFDQEQSSLADTTRKHLPLVFCCTANSAPAYASGLAVISRNGVKRTWPSRLPDVIVADTKVLCDSPLYMTLGGVGDTGPIFTAFADWYLGDYFGMCRYVKASREIIDDVNEYLLSYSGEIGRHTPVGMEVMFKIITLTGLSMTLAGESSPMSGYEHVISHMLDMGAGHFGRSTANHGTQVGVASILHLIGMGRLLDEFSPKEVDLEKCYPSFEEMEARVKAVFLEIDPSGVMGEECWRDYRIKLENWHAARPQFEAFLTDWAHHKAHLESLILRADKYVEAYHVAGHPLLFEELNVPVLNDEAKWAYQNAHLMRKRFSHADLLFFTGRLTSEWTEEVFLEMRRLVDSIRI
jgi:glycerol-1-phosphate dehydrogenase [NAD(P)+]